VRVDGGEDALVDLLEAERVVQVAREVDRLRVDRALAPARHLHGAEAGAPRAGVYAEDDHGDGGRRERGMECIPWVSLRGLSLERCQRLIVHLQGGVDGLNVLVVVELVEEAEHLRGVVGGEGGGCGGDALEPGL